MIHIEDNWYIRVDGYKCYVLGMKTEYTLKNGIKKVQLEDPTYHSDLAQAVTAYIEKKISNVLEDEEIELVDALETARREYMRYAELFKHVTSDPLD